jgi:hypothetical protein
MGINIRGVVSWERGTIDECTNTNDVLQGRVWPNTGIDYTHADALTALNFQICDSVDIVPPSRWASAVDQGTVNRDRARRSSCDLRPDISGRYHY